MRAGGPLVHRVAFGGRDELFGMRVLAGGDRAFLLPGQHRPEGRLVRAEVLLPARHGGGAPRAFAAVLVHQHDGAEVGEERHHQA